MTEIPSLRIKAVLITRGGGKGAKRFMLEYPERERFIMEFTKWPRVEPGTLTCDNALPLPQEAVRKFNPIAKEPEDLYGNLSPHDVNRLEARGMPSYYTGIAYSALISYPVILSQQPRPAVTHRLEILADVRLRDELKVQDGDQVELELFDPTEWLRITHEKVAQRLPKNHENE